MIAKEKVVDYFGSHENMTASLHTRVDETALHLFMMER